MPCLPMPFRPRGRRELAGATSGHLITLLGPPQRVPSWSDLMFPAKGLTERRFQLPSPALFTSDPPVGGQSLAAEASANREVFILQRSTRF